MCYSGKPALATGDRMNHVHKKYIEKLQTNAAETRTLLSNKQKPERERMVVRAFLRCIGEPFSGEEIQAGTDEPIDVVFRLARFQVREELGGRKPDEEWRRREQTYKTAKCLSDLIQPYTPSMPISLQKATQIIANSFSEKARYYGPVGCSKLDALVYIDLRDRHLWPLEPAPDAEVTDDLNRQSWRSVSMLFVPYGAILIAHPNAPDFLRKRAGHVLNQWPHCDGWFDS